jgi:hypothetical protein
MSACGKIEAAPAAEGASHLVMATAIGHHPEQVRPFIHSLRRSGYAGSVVIFVDRQLERALAQEARGWDVTLIGVPKWRPQMGSVTPLQGLPRMLWRGLRLALWVTMRCLRALPDGDLKSRLQVAVAGRLLFPTESRHFRYLRLLKGSEFRRILLADVRDVLFQSDPFRELPAGGLAVGVEIPNYTLGTEPHNAQWVKSAYGPAILERIGANPVSCAGVTYGERDAMMKYLDLMVKEVGGLSVRAVGLPGIDQAVHNVLVWTKRLDDVHELRPLDSTVATLNGVEERDVVLSQSGRLLNRDGSEPSVLHQYDRLPGLAPRLLQSLAQDSRGRR